MKINDFPNHEQQAEQVAAMVAKRKLEKAAPALLEAAKMALDKLTLIYEAREQQRHIGTEIDALADAIASATE